jgi:ketosteroid isomerase-like protein
MLSRSVAALLLLLCSLTLCGQVREKETAETREEKVRDLLEKFNEAYQQKNMDSLATFVASDLTGFAAGKTFSSWEQYRDNVLYPAFSRNLPPSTWEVEKIVTSPEMAWAYTKTSYKSRRQGQPVEADLYQVFVLQKSAAALATKNKPSAPPSGDWKIVLIDYTFHAEPLNQQAQPNAQPQGSGTQPHP